jgi:hypothetical protein
MIGKGKGAPEEKKVKKMVVMKKPEIMGGKGSIPPMRKPMVKPEIKPEKKPLTPKVPAGCRVVCKKPAVAIKPVKREIVGGKGSLPPQKILKKLEPVMEKKEEIKMIEPKMVGGRGSLPPMEVMKKIEKKPVKMIQPKMVGGKDSLPPTKVLKKVAAPKIVKEVKESKEKSEDSKQENPKVIEPKAPVKLAD